MTTYTVGINAAKNQVFVSDNGNLPSGFTNIGTFVHNESADVQGAYVDSHVMVHHVQDILYKRSAANPANVGFWPEDITDLASVAIYKSWEAAPFVLTNPTITGTAQVGQVLTSVLGSWSGSPTYARQWKANGVNVASGGTAATYTPVVGDIGKTITCDVTATNAYGSTIRTAGPTAAVIAA